MGIIRKIRKNNWSESKYLEISLTPKKSLAVGFFHFNKFGILGFYQNISNNSPTIPLLFFILKKSNFQYALLWIVKSPFKQRYNFDISNKHFIFCKKSLRVHSDQFNAFLSYYQWHIEVTVQTRSTRHHPPTDSLDAFELWLLQ